MTENTHFATAATAVVPDLCQTSGQNNPTGAGGQPLGLLGGPDQASYLRGLEYRFAKKPHGGQIPGSRAKNLPTIRTATRLAKTHGVSHQTIKNDAAFAAAVDALGRRLEKIEEPAAKERQAKAGPEKGRGKKKSGSGNLPEAVKGDTRDKVANALGMSGKKYEKAKTALGGSPRPFEARGRGLGRARGEKAAAGLRRLSGATVGAEQ